MEGDFVELLAAATGVKRPALGRQRLGSSAPRLGGSNWGPGHCPGYFVLTFLYFDQEE